MLKLKIKLFLLLVFFVLAAKAQINQYKYQRDLGQIKNNWQRLILPNDLFKHTQNSLADIRIYGIKGKDTIEVPYLLEQNVNQVIEKEIPFKIINQSKNSNGFYYTFQAEGQPKINQIRLSFKQSNFNWKVTLAGSNTNQEWFTILTDYRILAIKNTAADYHFTQLNFPHSTYKYFRILIQANEQPELNAAKILKTDTLQGLVHTLPIQSYHILNEAKLKQSQIEVKLVNPSPIAVLKLKVANNFDFYRPLTIEYATDSVKTDKGLQYNYLPLYKGTLSSLENTSFTFNPTLSNRLKITIDNQDNKPLQISTIELKGPIYELIARFDQLDYQYALYYGNTNAIAASYELKNFENKIPISMVDLALGEQKENPNYSKAVHQQALFENKMWLWTLMVLIIGLLAFFVYKMLKTTTN